MYQGIPCGVRRACSPKKNSSLLHQDTSGTSYTKTPLLHLTLRHLCQIILKTPMLHHIGVGHACSPAAGGGLLFRLCPRALVLSRTQGDARVRAFCGVLGGNGAKSGRRTQTGFLAACTLGTQGVLSHALEA